MPGGKTAQLGRSALETLHFLQRPLVTATIGAWPHRPPSAACSAAPRSRPRHSACRRRAHAAAPWPCRRAPHRPPARRRPPAAPGTGAAPAAPCQAATRPGGRPRRVQGRAQALARRRAAGQHPTGAPALQLRPGRARASQRLRRLPAPAPARPRALPARRRAPLAHRCPQPAARALPAEHPSRTRRARALRHPGPPLLPAGPHAPRAQPPPQAGQQSSLLPRRALGLRLRRRRPARLPPRVRQPGPPRLRQRAARRRPAPVPAAQRLAHEARLPARRLARAGRQTWSGTRGRPLGARPATARPHTSGRTQWRGQAVLRTSLPCAPVRVLRAPHPPAPHVRWPPTCLERPPGPEQSAAHRRAPRHHAPDCCALRPPMRRAPLPLLRPARPTRCRAPDRRPRRPQPWAALPRCPPGLAPPASAVAAARPKTGPGSVPAHQRAARRQRGPCQERRARRRALRPAPPGLQPTAQAQPRQVPRARARTRRRRAGGGGRRADGCAWCAGRARACRASPRARAAARARELRAQPRRARHSQERHWQPRLWRRWSPPRRASPAPRAASAARAIASPPAGCRRQMCQPRQAAARRAALPAHPCDLLPCLRVRPALRCVPPLKRPGPLALRALMLRARLPAAVRAAP